MSLEVAGNEVVVLFDAVDQQGIEGNGDLLLHTRILYGKQLILLTNPLFGDLLSPVDLLQGLELPLVGVEPVLVSVVVEKLLELVLGGLGDEEVLIVLQTGGDRLGFLERRQGLEGKRLPQFVFVDRDVGV